jgi:F-type H+-transporting ATPase subunit gamma
MAGGVRDHVFFRTPKGRRTAYIVITSNRGLCGSYNTNVSAAALRHMEAAEREEQILAVGARGRDYFQRHKKRVLHTYPKIAEAAFYEDAQALCQTALDLYTSGEADEVYLAFTHFESVLSHVPQVLRLLPVGNGEEEAGPVRGNELLGFEPAQDEVLDRAVPACISAVLYGALQESSSAEHAARMLSMDAAKKSAADIIEDLTRLYNRKRQAGITQEITEIIGGANVTN